MAEIKIEVPAELGLSQDDINELAEVFHNHLVSNLGGGGSGTSGSGGSGSSGTAGVRARPQAVAQSRPITQIKEVKEIVEVK